MTGDPERWIVIPRWDGPTGFQHYSDRDPKWIKNYRDLLSKDEYLELTFVQRGILHGLWLEYAAANRQLRDSTLTLSRRLGGRVTRASLDALNHAGFIEYSASRPLATRYQAASLEEETEREVETQGLSQSQELPSSKPTGKNGHINGMTDEPAFALLHFAVGATTDNLTKLRRAARGLPLAAIVHAREAAQGPGVRDPLAVALAELKKSRDPAGLATDP